MEVTCPAQTLQQLSRESLLYTWGPSCRVNSLPNRSTVSFADHNVYTTQKMQNALKPHYGACKSHTAQSWEMETLVSSITTPGLSVIKMRN